MLKKMKYILIALALISLMLGSSGCSLLPPWSPTPSPPVPSPPASRGEYTNPDWTSPSKSSEAGMPLPSIADVVEKIMPSVVSVTTEMVVYDIFQREYMQSAAGSGAIIDSEGYIVT
ncbi:MAG: hypothetical protein ACETVW_02100, partial [Dehalococcoidia bacterium]